MKKSVLIIGLIAFGLGVNAQNAVQDKDGNYVALTTEQTAFTDTVTGKTYTDAKGVVYDVYQGRKGGVYYWKISSKTGKPYKRYINTEAKKD